MLPPIINWVIWIKCNGQSTKWRAVLDYTYNFSGVVDLMGICFDYPEDQVISKRLAGSGAYRVWQNRIHGTQYDVWENDYNDPIPGETFTYPEFKGYFGSVSWMNIRTKEYYQPDQ